MKFYFNGNVWHYEPTEEQKVTAVAYALEREHKIPVELARNMLEGIDCALEALAEYYEDEVRYECEDAAKEDYRENTRRG